MPRSKYESDSGTIYAITLSAARLAVAGTPPSGAVNSDIKAKVSKSNREAGIRPRGVTLSREVGDPGDTASKNAFLPVLTPTAFASAGFQLGQTITYDGNTWTITARQGEDF